jgi:hypothetical protein
MIDKQHTFMNMEDEHEYEDFYDFSKTYENHPNAIQVSSKKEKKDGDGDSEAVGEQWEDVDFEDADEVEEVDEDEEEKVDTVKDSDSQSFDIIDTPKKDGDAGTPSFTQEDKPVSERFGAESVSSIKQEKRKGKTREEAKLGLDIKKAELLDTGEIKLGNGRIIGHRSFKYIYK